MRTTTKIMYDDGDGGWPPVGLLLDDVSLMSGCDDVMMTWHFRDKDVKQDMR